MDGQGQGIVEKSESRNICDDQKIPETMISQEQCLQNSFLKRSQSVFTTDKGKVEVGLGYIKFFKITLTSLCDCGDPLQLLIFYPISGAPAKAAV